MPLRRMLLFALAVPLTVWLYLTVERHVTEMYGPAVVDRSPGGVTLLSGTHAMDRLYGSMQGPFTVQRKVRLLPGDAEDLLWLRGIRITAVDPDGETETSPEFFCHANLTLTAGDESLARHTRLFAGATHVDWRLFTLVPGRLDVHLPEGFGIPIYASESLDLLSMSLNQSVPDGTVKLRFKTEVDFVRDRDRDSPMKPLFRRALYGYEEVTEADPRLAHTMKGNHPGQTCGPFTGNASVGSGGATCAGGNAPLGQAASRHGFVEALGPQKAIHWMVAPGHYERTTAVADQLDLPFDTTLHYVTGHLHPGGVSLTLVDRTVGETLFTLRSRDFADRWGVALVEERSYPEGLPLYAGHDYDLITVYDNRGGGDIDAMAILYLYLYDGTFEPPAGV